MAFDRSSRSLRLALAGVAVAAELGVLPAVAAEGHGGGGATPPLPPELAARIDAAASATLRQSGIPGASIAIVRDGRIAYVRAYGKSRLEAPARDADPRLRYGIGSIAKQFTATALLLLQEERKLSLDDRVSRYLPDLTRASEVTLRQLLTHTSGYRDYWPQDFIFAAARRPIQPMQIATRWGRESLDFEPGTKWQYSNTGYVIAGLIVEKVSGKPFFTFLRERIFEPLGMKSASDFDRVPDAPGSVVGYESYALGPPRAIPSSAPGWLFGTGDLAMTAEDLARWNVSLLERSLLTPESYRQMATESLLENGAGTDYGLGIEVKVENGRRRLTHGGEVIGFMGRSVVYPDDRLAIVVLVNLIPTRAAEQLSAAIAEILLERTPAGQSAQTTRAQRIFEELQQGRLDRGRFTANAQAYFSAQALADYQSTLGPLGPPQSFTQTEEFVRGGLTGRTFRAVCANRALYVSTYEQADGTLEQFQVTPLD